MTRINQTSKWTFSLTLLVAIVGATLFGGVYGNRLFGSPMQADTQKRLREYTDLISAVTSWAPEEVGSGWTPRIYGLSSRPPSPPRRSGPAGGDRR